MKGIFRLHGTIKHYDWGGSELIPALLNRPAGGQPFAEYWLGAHPTDHCLIEFPDGSTRLLRDLIRKHPELLGSRVRDEFHQLPYLLKLLDVRQMLSIQVHPDKTRAQREFARENAAGIPLNARNRNYRDPNHKPELMVALSEFWLLHGFKPGDKLQSTLDEIPEFAGLLPVFHREGHAGLYRRVMEMPQHEVNAVLQPLVNRLLHAYADARLTPDHENFWAARAANDFCTPARIDRGIFSIYFLNLVKLEKGEGIFQSAGVPHSYLEGRNVEIMASSDNVLRGGLTTKHIDVPELLDVVKAEPAEVRVIKAIGGTEKFYPAPAPDFALSSLGLKTGQRFRFEPRTAETLLLVSGEVEGGAHGQQIVLRKGEPAAICFPGEAVELNASVDSLIYRASVPGE